MGRAFSPNNSKERQALRAVHQSGFSNSLPRTRKAAMRCSSEASAIQNAISILTAGEMSSIVSKSSSSSPSFIGGKISQSDHGPESHVVFAGIEGFYQLFFCSQPDQVSCVPRRLQVRLVIGLPFHDRSHRLPFLVEKIGHDSFRDDSQVEDSPFRFLRNIFAMPVDLFLDFVRHIAYREIFHILWICLHIIKILRAVELDPRSDVARRSFSLRFPQRVL